MTNTLAIGLGILIAAFFGWDWMMNNADASLFLGKKTFDMIEWLAFWR